MKLNYKNILSPGNIFSIGDAVMSFGITNNKYVNGFAVLKGFLCCGLSLVSNKLNDNLKFNGVFDYGIGFISTLYNAFQCKPFDYRGGNILTTGIIDISLAKGLDDNNKKYMKYAICGCIIANIFTMLAAETNYYATVPILAFATANINKPHFANFSFATINLINSCYAYSNGHTTVAAATGLIAAGYLVLFKQTKGK
jgi:hypothetical protein